MSKTSDILQLIDLLQGFRSLNQITPRLKPSSKARKRLNALKKIARLRGILGLGVGYRVANGRRRREICMRVFVKKKLASKDLKPQHRIPQAIVLPWSGRRVAVDVQEAGERTEAAAPGAPPPLVLGGSRVRNLKMLPGTLSCIVEETAPPNRRCILSCSHVLGPSQPPPEVRIVLQDPPGGPLATFLRARPIQSGPGNLNVDAAIAVVIDPPRFPPAVKGLGPIRGFRAAASLRLGESVALFGSTTGAALRGRIVDMGTFQHPPNSGRFFPEIICDIPVTGGDSGAAVIDSQNLLVGLMFLKVAQVGLSGCAANPMDFVLSALGVRPVTT